jgi:hypothetical protein
MKYEQGIVAFINILGFKALLIAADDEPLNASV